MGLIGSRSKLKEEVLESREGFAHQLPSHTLLGERIASSPSHLSPSLPSSFSSSLHFYKVREVFWFVFVCLKILGVYLTFPVLLLA